MQAIKNIFILLLFSIILLSPVHVLANELESEPVATEQAKINESWIQKVETWYEQNMNYGSIAGLMVVESSFIPFPSEVVIPPAAYIASKPESNLNIFLVVLFGTIGALIGAYINYFLAIYLGRPVIYKLADSKFGKMLLLNSEKIAHAEDYFNKHGKTSTLIGRLIPGVRQLISLPAGLAKMNFAAFTLYTMIGAGAWNAILALLGYLAHGQADLIDKYSHEIGYIVIGIVLVVSIFLVVKYFAKRGKEPTTINND